MKLAAFAAQRLQPVTTPRHEKKRRSRPFSLIAPARRGFGSVLLSILRDDGGNRDHHNHHYGDDRYPPSPKSPAKMLSSANGAIIAEDDVHPVAFLFAFHELRCSGKKGLPRWLERSSPVRKLMDAYWVMMVQALSQPWDTGSAGVTVPMWATYSPSWVGTGARSAPRLVLAVQQQSASVRPVTS